MSSALWVTTAACAVLAGAVAALLVAWRGAVHARDATARLLDLSLAANTGDESTRRRLQHALEAVAEGVVVWDEAGAVVAWNEGAAPYFDERHPEVLAERTLHEMAAAALAGEHRREVIELYGPPRRALALAAAPLVDDRDVLGAVAVIEDVTERRRLEAVRRDFVANITHELKTPVGALALLAETLAAEDDPAVTERLVGRMLLEAQRVTRIIDDLLDLSRIESEEAPRREWVAVRAIVADAVELVRPAAEQHAISLRVDDVDGEAAVFGEPRQLVSAVSNLLDNAVKYSGPGSAVELEAHHHGGDVDVVVRDHGIGIPARDLERIFERFYRVDPARARQTGGTGLGLSIVRHVARNHGGEVFVESQEGEGSTFTLRLPGARLGLVAHDLAAPADVEVEVSAS